MTDNNRNRGSHAVDAYGRPRPASQQSSGDPLAELARLIGQQNESTPPYREAGAQPDDHDRYAGASEQHWRSAPDPFAERQQPEQYPDYSDPHAGYHEPHESGGGHDYARHSHAPVQPAPHYHHAARDQHDGRYDAGYAGYSDPGYGQQTAHYAQAPAFGAASPDYPADPAAYGAAPYGSGEGQYAYADRYYDDTQAAEDSGPLRRRSSLVTVLAVLALAVVGTAAAFGYRAMFGSSGTPVPPPVIKADTKPVKVVPAADSGSKPIQDRIGVQTERIVPREEQPVEMADPARAAPPRVVFPNLVNSNPALQATPAATDNRTIAEPKRIRTVTIKPDQPVETASARAAQPPRQPDSEPELPVQARQAAARAQPAAPNAPLALSPGAAPVASPQRQAARTSGAPFPAPISGSAANAGGYAVQVTSQRSEADAQASFRSLQAQFPSVLGNRQPIIRRADLGDKGIYYRAQVGPFGSQSEAVEFCTSLKSAGGQCVVQRN